jgi:predicted  nucleic acid-binding Zn-ribbon protein
MCFSITASASTPPDTFRGQIQRHLVQLSQEIAQLKKREAHIAQDKKESFQAALIDLKAKFQKADDYVSQLKGHAVKEQRDQAVSLVATLEHQIDLTDSKFSEKNLGLGSLLGF